MGFYAHMSREKAVPTAIANGCDLFLFNFHVEEDYQFMKKGIETGILTMERVNQAITRTIALKVSMGLFDEKKVEKDAQDETLLRMIGKEEFKQKARECADKAVTLVKAEANVLPISPEKQKRVMIYLMGDREDFYGNQKVGKQFIEAIRAEGFDVDTFDYSQKFPLAGETTKGFISKYDLAIYVLSEGTSSNRTTVRLSWNLPLANDAPWFLNDIPTIAVSFANPYHLRDLPEIKTLINAYTTSTYTVEAVINKLVGRSEFTGISPVDTTCGYYELNV
jgi:beta-N-acetylhexosaminidase